MPIPTNIKFEHVITAINFTNQNGIPVQRESTKYHVLYNKKFYPPKYIISLANRFANGAELDATKFSGGEETNNYLQSLGFDIVMSISVQGASSDIERSMTHQILLENNTELLKAYNDFSFLFKNSSKKYPLEIWEFKMSQGNYLLVIRDNDIEKYFPSPYQQMEGINSTRAAAFEYFHKKYGVNLFVDNLKITLCSYSPFRSKPLSRRYHSEDEFLKFITDHPSNLSIKDDVQEIILDIEGEIWEYESRVEGTLSYYYGKRYERDAINRKRAIEIHGTTCKVCCFNFEEVYGERGKDFIEVHHLNPLSNFDGVEVIINPETDLVPLCANCHRMIHRRHNDVLTLEQLKSMLRKDHCYNRKA